MGRSTSALRTVGTAIRNREIRAVLIAFVLFSAAEWVRWVGLLVFGFQRAGPSGAGLISVIQLVPAALTIPFTSSLADRFPRARVLAGGYVVAGVGTIGASVAMAADGPFLLVAVLAAVGLCGVTIVRPTQASLMPQLAQTPEQLIAANICSSFAAGGSVFVGPAIASVVLAVSGPTSVVLLAGLMLLLGAVLIVVLHGIPRSATGPAVRVHVLGGFRELGRNPGARWTVGLIALHAASWGMVEILLVTLALRYLHFGRSGVGVLSAALGVGALAGGAATTILVGRQRLAPALGFGVVVWSTPLLFVGLVNVPVLVLLLLAVAGIGISFIEVSGETLLQRIVSDEALGRVFGVIESGDMGAWALGSAAAPLVLHRVGIAGAFAVAALAVPLAAAIGWRQLALADREAVAPGPELELLRSIEMFRLLPESVLERLARNAGAAALAAGSLIIRQGEPGDLFYAIADGHVLVTADAKEVARYGPGGYFGEIALLRDVPRQASVTAIDEVRLITLERAHFLDAITGSSSAARAAQAEIGRRLGDADPL